MASSSSFPSLIRFISNIFIICVANVEEGWQIKMTNITFFCSVYVLI